MARSRPGIENEQLAREIVHKCYPMATSSYTPDGAEVYDSSLNLVLGRASAGDFAVELAWQAAANSLTQTTAVN